MSSRRGPHFPLIPSQFCFTKEIDELSGLTSCCTPVTLIPPVPLRVREATADWEASMGANSSLGRNEPTGEKGGDEDDMGEC